MSRLLAAEFLGTFILVFAGTGAIVVNELHAQVISHFGIAAAFGLAVMVVIYAVGDVSGAHINPAVTLGFCISGRFDRRLFLPYLLSQFTGAVCGSLALRFLFRETTSLGVTQPSGSSIQSLIMELILTWLLMFVILGIATGAKEKGIMAGIAVGGTVALEALFAGPVSGASMNPARSLAPALVSGQLEFLWIYLLGPCLGSLLAVGTWTLVNKGPSQPGK